MRIARFIFSILLAIGLLALSGPSRTQVAVSVSVRIGPPILPVYVQPVCPEPGFIWIPGYWAYGPDGYFWVPGTWVEPPEVGLLWTPGYWEWEDDSYIWHDGYWGTAVGYYGGIDYGFGYTGVGFFGGYWKDNAYYYNREVTNVDVTVVRNTYNTTVVNNNTTINRVSFNGGPGGTTARPSSREIAAEHQRHIAMTAEQTQHQQAASSTRTLLASVNRGRPDVAASQRAGQFDAHGAVTSGKNVRTNNAPGNPKETNRPENPPVTAQPPSATSVNPKLEQKHQQEQDQLRQQQAQERQRIEQKHQQEQQKLQERPANDAKRQDTERRQQQELQQLNQKHEQQQQKLQKKQQEERQKQKPEKPAPSKPSRQDKPGSQQ